MPASNQVGEIGWVDLTVPNADRLRDFYTAVVGWMPSAVEMGDYSDYCVTPPGGAQPVAGICHARGVNAKVPPQWLVYIVVADVDAAVAKTTELGGQIVDGPRSLGGMGRFCVIRDPAGAVCALVEPPEVRP